MLPVERGFIKGRYRNPDRISRTGWAYPERMRAGRRQRRSRSPSS